MVEMVVTGTWSEAAREVVEEARVESLVLNYALGFDEADLEFLRGLAVRKLVVLDRRLRSLDPIYELAPALESLQVTTDPSLSIDMSRLPGLTELWADWAQIKASFAAAGRLRRLFVGRYAEASLEPLAPAGQLESLLMKDRPGLRSLDGLAELPAIQELGVYLARKLTDISSIGNLPKLKELQLEGCKAVPTMEDLAGCADLQLLNFSEAGDFPDVEPLAGMSNVEVLYLHGSTRILSGDLTPIAHLPRLNELRMQNRRNYTPSVTEIQDAIAGTSR